MAGSAKEWRDYWKEGGGAAAPVLGSQRRQAELDRLWSSFFERRGGGRLLDIASGAASAARLRPASGVAIAVSVDIALEALKGLAGAGAERLAPVQADATRLPFADRSFALVVSQFGIEYAGASAFAEACRVVSPQGAFAAVCHRRGGPLDLECRANAEISRALIATKVFSFAREAILASHASRLVAGAPTKDAAAEKRLAAALSKAGRAVELSSACPGKDFVVRLVDDIARLSERRMAYAPDEILKWLEDMKAQSLRYEARMRAMNEACLGESQIATIRKLASKSGFGDFTAQPIAFENDSGPAAWWLEASAARD